MNFTDEALRMLPRQMYGESTAIKSREELEALLLPMIRVAIRTGRGRPWLVQWVEDMLATMTPTARRSAKVNPQWAAPRMARLLSSRMLQYVQAERPRAWACETIAGR